MSATRAAVGVDVGGTNNKGALVDPDGAVVLRIDHENRALMKGGRT